jgi:signal transduction histidine kinase
MTRLYLKIYAAVIAGIVLFTLLAGSAWHHFRADEERTRPVPWPMLLTATLMTQTLGPQLDIVLLERQLKALQPDPSIELSVFTNQGQLLASTHGANVHHWDLNTGEVDLQLTKFRRLKNQDRPAAALSLPNERTLVVSGFDTRQHEKRLGLSGFIASLLLIGAGIGAGAYPVVRRLTKQLESLKQTVAQFGQGNLSARSNVNSGDEVGALAKSFNQSAQKIQTLLESQRSLLANASHELRSPLARLKMALATKGNEQEASRNIAELDGLIDEILLASRLQAQVNQDQTSDWTSVDLAGLIAEECARSGADLSLNGTHNWLIQGDAKLLRRLIRNLIENALRYAPNQPVDAVLTAPVDQTIEIHVCDRGPGIDPTLRERVFEPFFRAPGSSEVSGGVGLGLSLARQIAQLHGASIHCEARIGGGSCFIVRLPPSATTL